MKRWVINRWNKIRFPTLCSLLNNDQTAVLDLMTTDQAITIHNVRLYLGIVKRRTDSIIHRLNYSDQPSKILAKRDRIPKFNIDDTTVAPTDADWISREEERRKFCWAQFSRFIWLLLLSVDAELCELKSLMLTDTIAIYRWWSASKYHFEWKWTNFLHQSRA